MNAVEMIVRCVRGQTPTKLVACWACGAEMHVDADGPGVLACARCAAQQDERLFEILGRTR